ncbi:DMT family transporter [Chromobacterium haemolyticum]|nr:DMT family transporter [Chromobacterium haemolyticum]
MNPIYPLFAFAIGVVVPLQAAINNQLKGVLGNSTLLAALVSFSVGSLCLAGLAVATGQKWQDLVQLGRVEWWMLLGGAMGVMFVFGTTLLAPRLGRGGHAVSGDRRPGVRVAAVRPFRLAGDAAARGESASAAGGGARGGRSVVG